VLKFCNELEVFNFVVEFVFVFMVDIMARWDFPFVRLLPDVDVLHDVPSTDSDSVVSLGCD